jgi:hypothetical protein
MFLAANFIVNPGQSDQRCCSTFLYPHIEMAEVHKPQSETTIIESFSGGNWQLFIFLYFCYHFNVLPHLILFLHLLDSQRFLSTVNPHGVVKMKI